jgi:ABC-2 type transport system permease protein/sodium transport system permease protein
MSQTPHSSPEQPRSATPPPRFNLARLGRLIRKELSEILRDRRTLLTLLLMPLLLYPLLGFTFYQTLKGGRVNAMARPIYNIGVLSPKGATHERLAAHDLIEHLRRGERALVRGGALVHLDNRPDRALPDLAPHAQVAPIWQTYASASLEDDLKEGRFDIGVRLKPDAAYAPTPQRLPSTFWEVLYREDSVQSREAARFFVKLVEAGDQDFLLRARGIGGRSRPEPLKLTAAQWVSGRQSSWLAALVPLILILMTITGAVYPAIDLTAGERERGTLEILIAAPIPRMSLLMAKYTAVLTVALLTALMNIVPMLITLVVTGLAKELFVAAGWLRLALLLLQVLGLLMLFTAFFSAILLAVTSFARSFKEAQAYLIPLMLLALTPGVLSLLPGVNLGGATTFVPLLNIVLLARDLLEGTATLSMSLLVIGITSLYTILAIALAARIFGTEALTADQPGKWRIWRFWLPKWRR